jgi:hypothetical protein
MRLRTLLLGCLLAALLSAPAAAAPDQESTFQDDTELLYQPPDQVRANLDVLQSLGVDRLRVTVLWKGVAPNAASYTRPERFDAADPESYPAANWDRYDLLLREAAARGLQVNFNVSGPSPLWANQPAPRDDILETFEPSPEEFGAFVQALGKRYSGEFVERDGTRLPRVDYWSIWNEPNHSGWLTPQWSADDPAAFPRAASLYRALASAAWTALGATRHGGDVIIVGETAPKGDRSQGIKRYIEAMTFLRALYCVDERWQPLTGTAGAELGCPANPADFRAANPALFESAGYAHHPYELLLSPSVKPLRPNWVTIANLSRLTDALDRIFGVYGSPRRMPIYLTEYGYQTNPPDPLGVTLAKQAEYLNQSEYIAWRNPRVRTLSQFLLVDDDPAIPASFQSGLLLRDSRTPKPAFDAYRLPIWLPSPRVRHGRSVRVWAQLRAAPNDQPATATVEYRQKGATAWRALKTLTVSTPRNYLETTVKFRRSGELRVTSPAAGASREAAVTIVKPKPKRKRKKRRR